MRKLYTLSLSQPLFSLDRLFFSQLKHVVIDEADTMFDKDFKEDMDKVIVPIKVHLSLSLCIINYLTFLLSAAE